MTAHLYNTLDLPKVKTESTYILRFSIPETVDLFAHPANHRTNIGFILNYLAKYDDFAPHQIKSTLLDRKLGKGYRRTLIDYLVKDVKYITTDGKYWNANQPDRNIKGGRCIKYALSQTFRGVPCKVVEIEDKKYFARLDRRKTKKGLPARDLTPAEKKRFNNQTKYLRKCLSLVGLAMPADSELDELANDKLKRYRETHPKIDLDVLPDGAAPDDETPAQVLWKKFRQKYVNTVDAFNEDRKGGSISDFGRYDHKLVQITQRPTEMVVCRHGCH